MRFFVEDHAGAIVEGEEVMKQVQGMLEKVKHLPFPEEDLEFLADTLGLIVLARRYYFTSFDEQLVEEIEKAKIAYKKKWPKSRRARFRVKTDFEPVHLKRRTLKWGASVLFRRQRGYRFVDYVFVLTLLGLFYRGFTRVRPKALPKFVRKSAMGVDAIFR